MDPTGTLGRRAQLAVNAWFGGGAIEQILMEVPEIGIYLAGGVVRDLALRRTHDPKDFDFFLVEPGVDEALRRLGESGLLTTGPFGSPRWYPQQSTSTYADVIPVSRFRNGLWPCEDIVDSLNQFDFTGNAIAVDLRTAYVTDPQHGLRDLGDRIMRAVRFDYPDEPMSPDNALSRLTVLWFRLLHYARRCQLAIEPITLAWLQSQRFRVEFLTEFEKTFFRVEPEALTMMDLNEARQRPRSATL